MDENPWQQSSKPERSRFGLGTALSIAAILDLALIGLVCWWHSL